MTVLKTILSLLGDFANVVAVIFAWLSISMTFKERKKDRDREDTRARKEQEMLWYNKIVLDGVVEDLKKYIIQSEKLLYQCKDVPKSELDVKMKEVYDIINNEFRLLCIKTEILKVFSLKVFLGSNKKLQEINDLYSEIINDSLSNGRISLLSLRDIPKLNKELVKDLYVYGIDSVDK